MPALKSKRPVTPFGIWDYDLDSLDLNEPAVARWYLERKIDMNDWGSIDYELLKHYLKELRIDPDKKQLLKNFIEWNEHFKSASKKSS